MNIEKNKVVSVSYVLRTEENGPVVEQTKDDHLLEFLFGRGMMLEKFEANLSGLSEGDKAKFHLTPAEGYGEYHNEMVVNLPINIFHDKNGVLNEEMVKIGNHIPMQDRSGNHLVARVLHVFDNAVKVDFNHDMAGKDLYFEVEVKKIREASDEEIEHGHVHRDGHCCHGEGGCHKHDGEGEHHCHKHDGGEGHHCCHHEE
jgi:FKBP-type peptidyl-prolyl cis-trans isomerase SlyD